ncbi:MAG TPA: serine/threonine-protein kinase [Oligoflexia bacterium]|nr:serine/threonine-protein kinase [Oligoflexia bacterium]
MAKIGQGGMAEVFKAVKTGAKGFEKTFALKRILPPFSDKTHFTAMLFDEAHLQAQLNHPNLVQVYDFAHDQEQYYLIMEYIEGIALKDLCKHLWTHKLDIPWQASLYILSQTLKALHYIHHKKSESNALGIVHRDVSPQNILLANNGQVKLADFGIAWSKLKQEQTRSGILKGKTSYLSPQQLNGNSITAYTDIFACAIVLYELLCKRNPFLGPTDYETMKNIENFAYINSRQLTITIPQKIHPLLDSILSGHETQLSAQDLLHQINLIQDQDWLSNGDILFATWLEQHNLQSISPKTNTLDKTVILTHQNTKTLKTKNFKKNKYSYALLATAAVCILIFLLAKNDFILTSKHQKTESYLQKANSITDAEKKQNLITSPAKKKLNSNDTPPTVTNVSKQKSSSPLNASSKLRFVGPEGSKVLLNGKHVLTLPADPLQLKPGTYLVQWTLKTGQNKIKRIQLSKDRTKILLWHSF